MIALRKFKKLKILTTKKEISELFERFIKKTIRKRHGHTLSSP